MHARRIPGVLRLVPPHISLNDDRIVTTRIATAMEVGDEAAVHEVWSRALVSQSNFAGQVGSNCNN